MLLAVMVHPASVQDRDGAEPLLRQARRLFPFVERIIGDAGYQGPKMDTSRNPAASSAEVGLRLLLLRREGSEVRSPGEGATSAAWSLACRAVRYAGAALPLSQTNRLML